MNFSIGARIDKFDNYTLCFIEKHVHNKYLDVIMPIVTFMGNWGIIWIGIAFAFMLEKQYIVIGNSIIVTLIISTITGEGIIKHIVRRVRPCNKQEIVELFRLNLISYSFPSGHTLSSFAVAEMLSMYFIQYKLIFMSIAFFIALSRLYLYVHYPTDVIAGIIIGVLCSKMIFLILQEGYIHKLLTISIFSLL